MRPILILDVLASAADKPASVVLIRLLVMFTVHTGMQDSSTCQLCQAGTFTYSGGREYFVLLNKSRPISGQDDASLNTAVAYPCSSRLT